MITQRPDTLSLSGNLKKFIVSSGSPVSFVLKDGDTVLLDATYEPAADGRVFIDVKEIVESRLSFQLSHNNFYEQTALAKTFTAIVDGETVTFKAIRAGVANLADTHTNWLKLNFLTWQPTTKTVTYYSPEWLTYYAVETCTLKLKAYFADGTDQVVDIGSMVAGKAYTANLQYAVVAGLLGQKYPSFYEVRVEASGEQLSYKQRYTYSEPKSELEQWFLFENSLGGIDTIRAYGDTDFEGDHEHKISFIEGVSSEYIIDTKRLYKKNTGYLDEYERRWLLDFFPSRQKFIHFNSAIRSIVVTESDVKYSAADLPSSYTFKYSFSNDSSLLNLVRNEEQIPADIVIPDITSPDFILPPRLSEYPRVTLSEGVILPAFDPHSDTPKTTTIGALAGAIMEETLAAIPGADEGGTMVQVLGEDSVVASSNKNVFSALRVIKEITQRIQSSFADFFNSIKDKFLRKDIEDTAAETITFLKGLKSNDIANLEKGFKTGEFGVNEFGDATLKDVAANKITSAEQADLKKGFKTGDWGLNEQGEFGARKITSSEAVFGDVTLQGAMKSPTFNPGMFGSGFFFGRTESGKILLELDDLNVRGTMTIEELIIHKVSQVGGAFLFSPAGGEVVSVQNMGSYWKLELKDKKNIFFKQYDQVLCQNFSENRKKRYWRLCTSVDYENGFIHLSKTDCEALSAEPEATDEIITFGNRQDSKRQNAILISSYGDFGAYQQFFSGVDSYDLTGKIDIQFGREIEITADKLEIRGRDGNKTRVPRERGEFVSGETYYYYDRVRHNGAFWLCIMQQTTATPSEKMPEWVKETNVRVGGVNLLREYAIQFDFKYWGGHTAQENVNFIMVDIDAIKANVKYMNVSPSLISWVFPEYEALISVRSNVDWTNF